MRSAQIRKRKLLTTPTPCVWMEALNGTTIDGDLGLGIRLGDWGSQEASVLCMPCEMDNYGIFVSCVVVLQLKAW